MANILVKRIGICIKDFLNIFIITVTIKKNLNDGEGRCRGGQVGQLIR